MVCNRAEYPGLSKGSMQKPSKVKGSDKRLVSRKKVTIMYSYNQGNKGRATCWSTAICCLCSSIPKLKLYADVIDA